MWGSEIDSLWNPKGEYPIISLLGGRKTHDSQIPDTFLMKRRHWSPLNFECTNLSVFYHFFSLNFFYVFRSIFIGDHKTLANKSCFDLDRINKGT